MSAPIRRRKPEDRSLARWKVPWPTVRAALTVATDRRWHDGRATDDSPPNVSPDEWLLTMGYVADRLGVARRTVQGWAAGDGMPFPYFDKLMAGLGYVSSEVWGDYDRLGVTA